MNRWLLTIAFIISAFFANAREYADTAIYQGISIKLDVGMPVFELIRSAGMIQNYEAVINMRLAKRFYPTIEGGYAMAECTKGKRLHNGQGAFGRLGMDLAVIKKGQSVNNLLIGLRYGASYQKFDMTNATITTETNEEIIKDFYDQQRFDCWGEIVAGCQVQVWRSFYMGWHVRMKLMFTRKIEEGGVLPEYLPGFGYRKDFNWGFNYYLAYHF